MCGASCWSKSPLVLDSPMQQGWDDQIPWHRGTKDDPRGKLDRICVNVYGLSLQPEHGPLKNYMSFIAKEPTKHAEMFPGIRAKYIENHNKRPDGRVTQKDLTSTVDVGSEQKDELIAPEEEFVTEAAWADELKMTTGVRPQRKNYPHLPWEQRSFRNGPPMWGYVELVGRRGRFKIKKSDSTFVKRGTRIHSGPELREGEAANKAQIASDAVLAKASDLSSMDFASMLKIMEGQDQGDVDEVHSDSSVADEKADIVVESDDHFQVI